MNVNIILAGGLAHTYKQNAVIPLPRKGDFIKIEGNTKLVKTVTHNFPFVDSKDGYSVDIVVTPYEVD